MYTCTLVKGRRDHACLLHVHTIDSSYSFEFESVFFVVNELESYTNLIAI